jgi:hypothetical protein
MRRQILEIKKDVLQIEETSFVIKFNPWFPIKFPSTEVMLCIKLAEYFEERSLDDYEPDESFIERDEIKKLMMYDVTSEEFTFEELIDMIIFRLKDISSDNHSLSMLEACSKLESAQNLLMLNDIRRVDTVRFLPAIFIEAAGWIMKQYQEDYLRNKN